MPSVRSLRIPPTVSWSLKMLACRERADGSYAEPFCLDPERVIEARAVILPGNHRGEFDQLRFIEPGSQAGEQRLGDFDRSGRHRVSVGEDDFLCLREQCTAAVIVEVLNLLLRDATLSADGRPDVDSKRAADQGRNAQRRQFLECGVDAMTRDQ